MGTNAELPASLAMFKALTRDYAHTCPCCGGLNWHTVEKGVYIGSIDPRTTDLGERLPMLVITCGGCGYTRMHNTLVMQQAVTAESEECSLTLEKAKEDISQYGEDPHLHLGEVGYNAYGEAADWLNYSGGPMSLWNELPEHIRLKWRAAAKAMRSYLEEFPPPPAKEDA